MWRVFLGLLFVSCAGESQHAPFQITLSRGGGFSGFFRGYHLYEGGRIEAWSHMPGKRDSVLWQTQVHPDSIGRLRDGLERSGALETVHRSNGNMTTHVSYSTDDTTFSWSWGNSGPQNLEDWYSRTNRFCAHVEPVEE